VYVVSLFRRHQRPCFTSILFTIISNLFQKSVDGVGLSFCQPLKADWGCGSYSNFCPKSAGENVKAGGKLTDARLRAAGRTSATKSDVLFLDLKLKTESGNYFKFKEISSP
jgi:hypothetical protein